MSGTRSVSKMRAVSEANREQSMRPRQRTALGVVA